MYASRIRKSDILYILKGFTGTINELNEVTKIPEGNFQHLYGLFYILTRSPDVHVRIKARDQHGR